MRIQHNIMAMNAYRNLGGNTSRLGKNLEKLSSGYKINRAGDDAAGLAISEKMRAQITGLKAATKNTKDAVSMIKTTEGALQEVQDMLNRMVYLAEQSANGIYEDGGVDRNALNDEVSSLKDEINRIADTANFNGTKLLDGSLSSVVFQIGDSAATADQLDMSAILSGAALASGLKDIASAIDVSTDELALSSIALLRDGTSGSAAVTDNPATTDVDESKPAVPAALGLIDQVSQFRGRLGAVQNRLEHTLNNLGVMTENIQDAESTIRDTDVAEEMMDYTKNNILIQSAQAMLAQANQVPQGVLQLMQ